MSDGFFFIKNSQSQKITELYKQINDITTWEIYFYVPYWSSKYVDWKRILSNPRIKVCFYNDIPYCGNTTFPWLKNKLYEHGWASVEIWSVVQASIMLAIISGYKSIHLYGVDNNDILSIAVNSRNQVGFAQGHFYDDSAQHSFRVCLKENGEPYRLSSVLYRYYNTFLGYQNVADYAKRKGSVVINHTKNSLIDSFKRAE